MKPTVYIETTIIGYLTARPSRDPITRAHQELTKEWWNEVRPKVECLISPFVLDEIQRGDEVASRERLDAVAAMKSLDSNDEIDKLAEIFLRDLQIPLRSKTDASHLAIAVWYRINYLLTWNCTHIANAVTQAKLQRLCRALKLYLPVICTPKELMEV